MQQRGEEMSRGEYEMDPVAGNVTFLAVAIGAATHVALDLFRYRSSTTYFDAGEIFVTNYWKIGYQIGAYGALASWIVLAISQLVSMFGYGNEMNITLWLHIAPAVGGLVRMVQGVMGMIAYE